MPLDHFVSQVHLRNFASPKLDTKRIFAIRKRDLFKFHCSAKDVCRVADGSTNAYLAEPRIVEEFLKEIEPRYNAALDALRSGRPDPATVFVVSGFAAYVATCSPTAMRLNVGPLRGVLEATAETLDANGAFPPPPESLGASTLTELLQTGAVKLNIDAKYPQAIGIAQIERRVAAFGNSDWDIYVGDERVSPFFTSDYPVGVDETADNRVMARVVPLAPDLAVRIVPHLERSRSTDLSFPHFRFRMIRATKADVASLNRIIVRCADELVFFRDDDPWVARFVENNASFCVTTLVDSLVSPTGGTFTVSRTRIRPRSTEGSTV